MTWFWACERMSPELLNGVTVHWRTQASQNPNELTWLSQSNLNLFWINHGPSIKKYKLVHILGCTGSDEITYRSCKNRNEGTEECKKFSFSFAHNQAYPKFKINVIIRALNTDTIFINTSRCNHTCITSWMHPPCMRCHVKNTSKGPYSDVAPSVWLIAFRIRCYRRT